MIQDLHVFVDYYVAHLAGPRGDEAFHALIHAPTSALPLLVDAYKRQTTSPATRAAIVEVVWQFRDQGTVPFLAEALQEEDEDIWKQALDGLVTIGGIAAIEALRAERHRRKAQSQSVSHKVEWIDEAIGQIESGSV